MNNNKKLNLNKYAYLDYLKGDIFAWLNCNENYQKAAQEDKILREATPWRYTDEEDSSTNENFESDNAERYGLDLSKELPDQIKAGLRVGEYSESWAKANYPNHEVININKQTNVENVAMTKDALTKDNVIIFEATFSYNDFVIRTDLLIKTDGQYEVIEVKGSTKPKLVYGYDLFFQKEIIERSNPEYIDWEYSLLILDKTYIHNKNYSIEEVANNVFVNVDYISNGELSKRKFKLGDEKVDIKWSDETNHHWLNTLVDWDEDGPIFQEKRGASKVFTFSIEDFFNTSLIEKEIKEFDNILERIKEIQLMDEPPLLELEDRNNRFMSSDYMVWAQHRRGIFDFEDDSVFEFRGNTINFNAKCELFKKGIKTMGQTTNSQITPNNLDVEDDESEESIILDFINDISGKVSKYSTIIQKHYRNKEEYLLHRDGIYEELDKYTEGPIYMYDFETANLAIPRVDGTKPYEQVVYQYSIHVILDPSDYDFESMHNVKHYEWLAEEKDNFHVDGWKEFVKVFEQHGPGIYVAWNDSFEKGCLRRAQTEFLNDDEISWIDTIQNETIDLMIPFRKKYYYHKDLKGSYSIKYAGPHFAKEINYKDLPLVQRGDQSAAVAKEWLRDDSEESDLKWKERRQGMLKYCEYDTLLMVAILQRLQERVKGDLND